MSGTGGKGALESLAEDPTVLAVVDADGTIRCLGGAARVLGGLTVGEGGLILDLVHPDDRTRARATLAGVAARPGALGEAAFPLAHADGCWRTVWVRADNRLDDPSLGAIVLTARGRSVTNSTLGLSADARDLLDTLNEVVFRTDAQGIWTYLNRAWERVTGFSVTDTLGRSFLEFVHPQDREQTQQQFRSAVAGGAPHWQHDTRYLTASGGHRWVELRGRLIYGEDGVVANAGTILDITERRRAEELLGEQAQVLELVARDAPLTATLGSLVALLAQRTGGSAGIVNHVEQTCENADRGEPAPGCDQGSDTETDRLVTMAWQDAGTDPVQGTGAGAAAEHAWPHLAPIRSPSDRSTLLGAFVLTADPAAVPRGQEAVERCCQLAAIAIERKRAQDEVRRQALHDPLTGLPNRGLVSDRLSQALRAARRSGVVVALLLIDIDHFKEINDGLGHDIGDQVLRAAATRLRSELREADTVGRLGGDEFCAVLSDAASAEDVQHATERLLAAL